MMNRKQIIGPVILALLIGIGAMSGCVSTDDGEQGVEALESMSDAEFNKWQLYITLGTKIGANQLLEGDLVTEEELAIAATTIETVRDQSVVPGATSFIVPALQDAGLNNDEIELLMLIVEQELLARGALDWVDPDTGVVDFSPRTQEILTSVANALRAASVVTDEEVQQGMTLEESYGMFIEEE